MLESAINVCPDEAWTKGTYPCEPARMALHLVGGASFYGKLSENVPMIFCKGMSHEGPRWTELSTEQLPSKETLRSYALEIKALWTAFLSDKDDAWTGETRLEQCVFNLRHMMAHIGHIDVTIRENGGEEVEWN
jgi:hypothetical protein